MIKEIEATVKETNAVFSGDPGYKIPADKYLRQVEYLLDRVKRQEAVVGAAKTFIFTEDGDRAMIAYLQLKYLLNNPKEENSL